MSDDEIKNTYLTGNFFRVIEAGRKLRKHLSRKLLEHKIN